MLTKGAIGNLVNRYRAVLKKCNLINTFGSLAVASMLVMGGAGVASADEFGLNLNATSTTLPSDTTLKAVSDTDNTYGISIKSGHTLTANKGLITIISESSNRADGLSMYSAGTNNFGADFNIKAISTPTSQDGNKLAQGIRSNETNATFNGKVDIYVENQKSYAYAINATNNGTPETSRGLTFNNDVNIEAVTGSSFSIGVTTSAGGAYTKFNGKKLTINATANGTGSAAGLWAMANGSSSTIETSSTTEAIINATSTSGTAYGIISYSNVALNGSTTITAKGKNAYAMYIANGGTITINGNTNISGDIYIGDGSTLNGSGTLIVNDKNDKFTAEAGATVSGIKAKGSATLNDATGGDINALNKQLAGLDIKATGMDEGLISGAVDANGNQKVNTVMQDTLDMATSAPLAVGRIVMNDVRKRMGDLRSAPGEAGVWMRWDGGKLKGDAGLTNDFNTIQVGGDHKVGKNCRFGVAAAFTHGDLDHSNGNGEMETYSFSAYSTWMGDNGMFADVIARVGFTKSEISMKGQTIDLDNEALSLSAEYGWRFDLCKQFYVEPQVELTYTYLTEADSEVSYATYKTDSVDSLIGRAGLAAGWKLPNEMGDIYARASVVQEFLGDTRITGSAFGRSVPHSLDGQDTWLEYGIGANIKLTDKTYIWADVERTEGADIDEEWRGTVGIRFSF